MCEEFVNGTIEFYFNNDYNRGLQLIQKYGYNTFDPNKVFSVLNPSHYFENYKKDIEDNELKLFYSGFRKYMIEKRLLDNRSEREVVLKHLLEKEEYETLLHTLKTYNKNVISNIYILDRFLKNFKPIVDNTILQQWINITQMCISSIKGGLSRSYIEILTYKLPHTLPCTCELCASVQKFLKSSKDSFSKIGVSKTSYDHVKSYLEKLERLSQYWSNEKLTINKSGYSSKNSENIMRYALENLNELLQFLIHHQTDKDSRPQFSFTKITASSPAGEESVKREAERVEKEKKERIEREEAKKREAEEKLLQKKKLEEEALLKKKKREEQRLLKKKQKEEENRLKKEREEEDKELRKVEKELKKRKKEEIKKEQPTPASSSQSSSTINTPSHTVQGTNSAIQTQPIVPQLTCQLGTVYSQMQGMPLVPISGNLIPPNLVNLNTVFKMKNDIQLSQYFSTAMIWTPLSTPPELITLSANWVSQYLCTAVQISPSLYFLLMPIQRYFQTSPTDLRFISIVTDLKGIQMILAPIVKKE